jgi:hypothetical protein
MKMTRRKESQQTQQRQTSQTEPSRSATDIEDIELFVDAISGKVKLQVIDVIDDIDVLVSEDWQNSNGDIVTDTVAPDEEVRNLRMIHLRRNGKVLLAVEITDEQFASLNLKTSDVESLFDAVEKQRFDDVKALVQKGVDVNSSDKDELNAPLHKAVLNDSVEIAEFLVANGARIQVHDQDENTPLHEAAHSGNIAIVEFLLANGADRYATNFEGSTPLHFSVWNEDINVVKRFIANREDANLEAALASGELSALDEG